MSSLHSSAQQHKMAAGLGRLGAMGSHSWIFITAGRSAVLKGFFLLDVI